LDMTNAASEPRVKATKQQTPVEFESNTLTQVHNTTGLNLSLRL
jgi:hypothetical protein